jgi:hypothetical protein
MKPLTVTVDELRAVAALADVVLPRFVTADDDSDPRVDAAALRGLAARALVTLDQEVRLGAELSRLCGRPDSVVELEVEDGGALLRCAVVGATVFLEQQAGLVRLEPAGSALDLVNRLGRLDQIAEPGPHCFTVPTKRYLAADDLLLAGDPEAAVATLGRPGADAWIEAVRTRRHSVSVAAARGHLAVELCWLVAGDGTAWRVTTGPAGVAGSTEVTTVRQVAAAELAEALAEVLEPASEVVAR